MLRAPGVVLISPKFPHRLEQLSASARVFGVRSLVWTGSHLDLSKHKRLPREERMKGYKSVQFLNAYRPLEIFEDFTLFVLKFSSRANRLRPSSIPKTPFMSSARKTARFPR